MMKAKGYIQTIFVVVLISFNVLGEENDLEEPNENSQPYYEYIQIYKSIPTLFEYLLNALEERPEILETNDVTMFKRNVDGIETEEYDSNHEENIDKRDAENDITKTQEDHDNVNYVNKKETSDHKGGTKTTVAYEYGNSNVVMKGLNDIENNKVISKRFANNDNLIEANEEKRELLKRENKMSHKKRSVLFKLHDDTNDMFQEYGDMFFGFEHLFGLDLKPEDIEERILAAEKLLEDHNNKKGKK